MKVLLETNPNDTTIQTLKTKFKKKIIVIKKNHKKMSKFRKAKKIEKI